MTASVGVVRTRSRWAFWRSLDMAREAVRATVGGLLDAQLDAVVNGPPGVEELTWAGRRVGSQWLIRVAGGGVAHVAITLWDIDRDSPREEYRAELPTVVEPLRRLSALTGARLFVDGGEATDLPLDEIIDLVA